MSDYFLKMWGYLARTEIIVAVIIAGIVMACVFLLIASVSRRIHNGRRYLVLDNLRSEYLPLLRAITNASQYSMADLQKFMASPDSTKWAAIEDNLFTLLDESPGGASIVTLFEKLGYLKFYRAMLNSSEVSTQAAAITKLGLLKDHYSAEKMLELLKKGNTEINAATVRAFCKIGNGDLLPLFLMTLSDILDKKQVSTKTIDTSLALLPPQLIPLLLKFAHTSNDARIVASILKVLGNIPSDNETYEFAIMSLDHEDPEVRAKASKVIANFEITRGICNLEAWPKLLKDPVWFVRLQAVRVMGKQQCKGHVEHVSALIVDEKWQVRNAAVEALINLSKDAVVVLSDIMSSSDRYAKESICEVMQRTGFVDKLLAWLDEGVPENTKNICDIFAVMVSLGFTSQLKDYIERTDGNKHVAVIEKMLAEKAA